MTLMASAKMNGESVIIVLRIAHGGLKDTL